MSEKDKATLVKQAELSFKKAENAWCEAKEAMDEAERLLGQIQDIETTPAMQHTQSV